MAVPVRNGFSLFAAAVNQFVSSAAATGAAFLLVVVWASFGPVMHYSQNWQLVINTGTTIVTFLMVFVLNHAQSRDTIAINAKLDSLIMAIERADNRLVGLERLPITEAEEVTAAVVRSHQDAKDLVPSDSELGRSSHEGSKNTHRTLWAES